MKNAQHFTRNSGYAAPVVENVNFGARIYSSSNTSFDMLGAYDMCLRDHLAQLPIQCQRSAATFVAAVLYISNETFTVTDTSGGEKTVGTVALFLKPLQRRQPSTVARLTALRKGRVGRQDFITWVLSLVDKGFWKHVTINTSMEVLPDVNLMDPA